MTGTNWAFHVKSHFLSKSLLLQGTRINAKFLKIVHSKVVVCTFGQLYYAFSDSQYLYYWVETESRIVMRLAKAV